MSASDTRYMALALSLGRRGLGQVWPNPAVGCVIVKNNCIVGRGWTRLGGRPHGEAVALDQAGGAAKGATAYVTLEPCAHHGETPPCAAALIAAGVARVVIGLQDPDPRVNGAGLAMLRAANVAVTTGVLQDQAKTDHEGFLSRVMRGRPHLALKLASSFDGRIATASGESRWITGAAARRYVHALRARFDAVMIGGGTARADDPSLNVRGLGIAHQPVRVVLSRRLDLPLDSQLSRTARQIPLWICHGGDADPALITAWQGIGATLIPVPLQRGQLDVGAVLNALAKAGLTRVFCEGGGALAASLLRAGLVDELIGFTTGLALGSEGRPALAGLGLDRLADAPRFNLAETRDLGGDVLHRWVAAV